MTVDISFDFRFHLSIPEAVNNDSTSILHHEFAGERSGGKSCSQDDIE